MGISIDPELNILNQGVMTLKGEFLWGSNYTFLVEVEHQGKRLQGVYKPVRGERPLWDFPAASLSRREVAAFILSEVLGWNLVPPTVYRKVGPLGAGSLQLYVNHDPEYHYFNFTSEDVQRLRPTAVFDLLINNADRKGSHILKAPDGHLWLIDHGVCFHVEDKLRTVVWDFVSEKIPPELLLDLQRLLQFVEPVLSKKDSIDKVHLISDSEQPNMGGSFGDAMIKLLSRTELRALARRANNIINDGVFPAPDPNRRPFPWPQI